MDLIKDTICTVYCQIKNSYSETLFEIPEDNNSVSYELNFNPNSFYGSSRTYATDMDGNAYCDTSYLLEETGDYSALSKIIGFEYGQTESEMAYVDLENFEYEVEKSYTTSINEYIYQAIKKAPISVNPYKDTYLKIYIADEIGSFAITGRRIFLMI